MDQGFPSRVETNILLSSYGIQPPERVIQVRRLTQQLQVFQAETLVRSIGLGKNDFKIGSTRVCFRLLTTNILNNIIKPTNDYIIQIKAIYEKKLASLRRWSKMYQALLLVNMKSMVVNERPNLRKRKREADADGFGSIKMHKTDTNTAVKKVSKFTKTLRYDQMNHFPAVIRSESRNRCKMEGCNLKTNHYCIKCNVHLCIKPNERNCFLFYHTPKLNKKK